MSLVTPESENYESHCGYRDESNFMKQITKTVSKSFKCEFIVLIPYSLLSALSISYFEVLLGNSYTYEMIIYFQMIPTFTDILMVYMIVKIVLFAYEIICARIIVFNRGIFSVYYFALMVTALVIVPVAYDRERTTSD